MKVRIEPEFAQVSSSAQFTPTQQVGAGAQYGGGQARGPAQAQGGQGQGQGGQGQQGKGEPIDSIRNSELYALARFEESEKQRVGANNVRAPGRAALQQQSAGYPQTQARTFH